MQISIDAMQFKLMCNNSIQYKYATVLGHTKLCNNASGAKNVNIGNNAIANRIMGEVEQL